MQVWTENAVSSLILIAKENMGEHLNTKCGTPAGELNYQMQGDG